MFEPKAPYRRTVVISLSLFLSVEAHALGDDLFGGAGGAPDCEGAFEAYGEDARGLEFGGAGAERVAFARGLVVGEEAFLVGRDVASHVEALHLAGSGEEVVVRSRRVSR